MSLARFGLILISLSWVIQFLYILKGKKDIKLSFVVTYMLGVLLVLVNGYMYSLYISIGQLATFLTAGLVLIAILRKK